MFGILERAKQFAKEATNYISSIIGSDNETKPAQTSKNNSPNSIQNVDNKTVDTPEDKFVKQPAKSDNKPLDKTDKTLQQALKQQKNGKSFKNYTEEDVLNINVEIEELKKQYIISDEEYYNIILPRVGYSKKEFLQLNNNQKMFELEIIRGAMKLFASDKYIKNPNLNKVELIADAAGDFKKLDNNLEIQTFEEFDKAARPYISRINIEYEKAKSEEDKIDVLEKNRLKFEFDIEKQRAAELKLCKTDAEKKIINAKYNSKLESFEGYLQTNFLADHGDPNNAYISTYLRCGKSMADGYRRALNSFSCEVRSCAAGTFTHERRVNQAKRYFKSGDSITAKSYGECTEIVTQHMKKADLEKYEADAHKFKQEYYKNPKKYSFITEEHLTQESVGIALGAALNNNMTASEKAAFLRTWNEHAKNFSDYDEVRGQFYAGLKQYLEKHPEAKQGIEDIKTKYQEQYGEPLKIPYSAKKRYDNRINEKKKEQNIQSKEAIKITKATPKQLEDALASMSFEDARKQFTKNTDKDFAEVVIHNPKLKCHKQRIVPYLKTLPAKDLYNITKGCNTEMYLFVLRNISPDKAGCLYDLSKGEKCYAARKLGENIIEESMKNAAA